MRAIATTLLTTITLVGCIDSASESTDDVELDEISSEAVTPTADLTVSTLTNPPATVQKGQPISVSDTVMKTGEGAAAPSQTVFYLSSTGTPPFAYKHRFAAQRSVPQLLADGATSSGTTALTIGGAFAPSGAYFIVACADYGNAVTETSESNNCRASTSTVEVTGADLQITSLQNPPSTIRLGEPFTISDTLFNGGTDAATSSDTAYYLSSTAAPPFNYRLRFPVRRTIASLATNASDTNPVTLTAQSGIEEASPLYLVACADYGGSVGELNEANNCTVASAPTSLQGTDLVVSAITRSPSVITPTSSFTVGETVTNQKSATAVATQTRYVVSSDSVLGSGDQAVVDCVGGTSSVWRNVAAIAAGQSNTGTTTLTTVCVEDANDNPVPIAVGTYYLFACADGTKLSAETNETNNCSVGPTFQVVLGGCGNGIIESGEQCDDSNTDNGDGCSATCQTQTYTSLSISPANVSIQRNATQQYTATANYSDGWTQSVTGAATWSTDAAATATITNAGLATGVAAGTTVVRASWNSRSASTNITVLTPTLQSIAISPANPSLVQSRPSYASTLQLSAVGTYSDGSTATVSGVSWSSATPSTLHVNSSSGLATAGNNSTGAVTVTATSGSLTATTTVTVTARILNIQVRRGTYAALFWGPVNSTHQLTAIANLNGGGQRTLTDCAWSSASSSNISVDSSGLATIRQFFGGGVNVTCTKTELGQNFTDSITGFWNPSSGGV